MLVCGEEDNSAHYPVTWKDISNSDLNINTVNPLKYKIDKKKLSHRVFNDTCIHIYESNCTLNTIALSIWVDIYNPW